MTIVYLMIRTLWTKSTIFWIGLFINCWICSRMIRLRPVYTNVTVCIYIYILNKEDYCRRFWYSNIQNTTLDLTDEITDFDYYVDRQVILMDIILLHAYVRTKAGRQSSNDTKISHSVGFTICKSFTMHNFKTWSPFYWYRLTLIPAWIRNHLPSNVWDDVTYP